MDRKQFIFNREGHSFPGSTYADVVLKPAYENAKQVLLHPMLEINKAHLIMLVEQSLISKAHAYEIIDAIDSLNLNEVKQSEYTGEYEDLFFYVESKILDIAGEVGGSLHLARSRNDMGVAMYRMTARELLLQAISSVIAFQQELLEVAQEHVDTLFLGYTHTQQAQPMTFSHYLIAVYDVTERDLKRLFAAYETCNKSPLGAAALTTSGFKINRHRTAELLGFQGLVENSYDAIAGADYLGETASVIKLALINLGRFTQELLLWSTQEFGVLKVADPYVQISSIMPQKRNPVSLEHIRALSSSGVGSADAVLQMIHNTPFGDINDTEDDLQPHLWKSIETLSNVFKLGQVVIGTAEVDKERVKQRTQESFATITELADTIVRKANLPFRTSHTIVSTLVKKCLAANKKPHDITIDMLNDVALETIGTPLNLSEETLHQALDPVHFVAIRSLPGGPAPEETERMIESRKEKLSDYKQAFDLENNQMSQYKELLDEITNKWRIQQ